MTLSLANKIKLAMSIPVKPIHESRMATMEKQGVALDEYWQPTDNRYLCELKEPTDEDRKLVDGKTILGVFEGCFFVPNGFSRNKRFYSKELWEKALNSQSLKERLENRKLFGALGHEDKPLDEKDIAQGKHAFNTVKLWIDESTGLGMGKALIMNTESGWNMYCAMKTGAKFQMSSRAKGGFKEGVHKIDENGVKQPVVDPDTYNLFTWDAVLDPGFTETSAVLQESKNNNDKEKSKMNLEEMLKQKDSALTEALSSLTSLTEEVNTLKAEKEQLSENLKKFDFLNDMDKTMFEHIQTFTKDNWNSIFEGKVRVVGDAREVSYQDGQIGYDAVFIPTNTALISESRVKAGMYQASIDESVMPVKVALVNKATNPVYGSDGIILAWNVGARPSGASHMVSENFVGKAEVLFESANKNSDRLQELENKLAMYENEPSEYNKLIEACENSKYALEKYVSLGSYPSVKEALEISVDVMEKLNDWGGIGAVVSKLEEVVEVEAQVGPLNQLAPELEAIEETFLQIQELGGTIPNIRRALEVSEAKLQEVLAKQEKEQVSELETYAHEYSQKCGISEQEAFEIIESFGGNIHEAEAKVFKLMENRNSYRPAPRRESPARTRQDSEDLSENYAPRRTAVSSNDGALVSGFYKSMRKGNFGR